MFQGSMVAIVTPFKDGKVDEKALKGLVEFHVRNGTSAVVPCGTTGESATLTHDEHDRVIEITVEAARGRVQVVAGTGSNSTAEAIRLTKAAKKAGVDGSLQIAPYYNRPTQQGLFLHFKAVADAVDLPIILYNIPGRTGVNVEPDTVARLVQENRRIVAIKEASANLEQMMRLVSLCGEKLALLSGDDALTLPILAIGGVGVISVVANVAPRDTADLVRAYLDGRIDEARRIHYQLLPLVKAMFLETNPIPVKASMEILGMIDGEIRLPLCPAGEETRKRISQVLSHYGLLKRKAGRSRIPAEAWCGGSCGGSRG